MASTGPSLVAPCLSRTEEPRTGRSTLDVASPGLSVGFFRVQSGNPAQGTGACLCLMSPGVVGGSAPLRGSLQHQSSEGRFRVLVGEAALEILVL